MAGYLLLAIVVFALVAFFVGQSAGKKFVANDGTAVHSLPGYHGAFVAIWVGVPALLIVVAWLTFQNTILDQFLIASLPASMTEGLSIAQRALLISEIKNVAGGVVFGEPSPAINEAAARFKGWQEIAGWAMVVVALAIATLALFFSRSRLASRFRARSSVESFIYWTMVACSAFAILVTAGIVVSLVAEAWRFFSLVPAHEFFFGLRWEPQIPLRADQIAGAGAFGAVPVFLGTIVVATIAMVFATPIGIFTAIYLTEYASERTRAIVKPMMELLAGVPTVVYGFFAVLTVAPAIRNAGTLMGLTTSPNSALAAGGVMAIMIIPFISSLSDDALRAVPRSMRDGSLAMGATRAETMTKVLLPAALPGIAGGILLALSRAIGETMIVVMAAGLIASLNINPLDSVTTVTVQIVTLLIGDTSFDNPKTLAAFALGLVLFLVTLGLNVIALNIVRKYREQYD
ncbi:MAG: phosphate ABC transporter permease subunit PstC [Pelagibacterium sp. SCN 63-23]|nr:MAG: phosphate ABC transporter permease subunit PstC [Pelagibacterium sp. SCN 63-23]